MESELYLLFFLLRFQVKVLLPVGGVVKLMLHLLWLSRRPAFPGLSTEPPSHYREHFINAKKTWNVILLEWGCIQKHCALGCAAFTRSQNKYPDFNTRPIRVAQSLWRWDVELENVNRCGDILMHFWKDKLLSCCYILDFTPCPCQNMVQKAIVTSFSFLNLSGEQKTQSSSRWGNNSA